MRIRSLLLLAGVMAATPFACFYPEYSFVEPEPSGTGAGTPTGVGGGPATSSSSSGGAGGTGGAGGAGGAGGGQGGGGEGGAGGAGGGQGGTGGAGGAGGGSGGEGGTPVAEDCTDGLDDNENGLVDCDDPFCSDYSCVNAIPADWTGYFVLYDGAPGQDPGCPDEFQTEVYLGNGALLAPPAECSQCTCSAPAGQVCDLPNTVNIVDGQCDGSPQTFCGAVLDLPPNWNGTCQSLLFNGNPVYLPSGNTCGDNAGVDCSMGNDACNVSISMVAPSVTGGTCTSGGGVADVPNVSWTKLGRVCGDPLLNSGGCNANQVCLPRPDGLYESGVCIMHDGNVNCPPGAFSEKHSFFEDFTDTRACSACSCGAASGATCQATINVFSDLSSGVCNTNVGSLPAGGCDDFTPTNPNVSNLSATITQPPSGGSCPTNGGQPTGAATAITPTTVCCIP